MKIIRDENTASIHTAALCIEWGLWHCNQNGCLNPPTTIISGVPETGRAFALCEAHFQMCNKVGGGMLQLVWD